MWFTMVSVYIFSVLIALVLVKTTVPSLAKDNEKEKDFVSFTQGKREQPSNSKPVPSPRSCIDHLNNEESRNGMVSLDIMSPNGKQRVLCDFRTEPGSAWTLVLSHQLQFSNNNDIASFKKPLNLNLPVNEKTPNLYMYRMTHDQMGFIKNQSTHWRVTCSGGGIDYTNYLRAKFSDFDPLTFLGRGVCKKVEIINVRGHAAIGVTAAFWQVANKEILHHDSSVNACQFGSSPGYKPSEDNFGFYKDINKNFRCSSYYGASTNIWFGGYP